MLSKTPKVSWILNQVLICLFGVLVSFHGYRAFLSREFRVYHYGITLDLGEYHGWYGGVLIVLGAAMLLVGLMNFRRCGKI